jgi:hypothetical protein
MSVGHDEYNECDEQNGMGGYMKLESDLYIHIKCPPGQYEATPLRTDVPKSPFIFLQLWDTSSQYLI